MAVAKKTPTKPAVKKPAKKAVKKTSVPVVKPGPKKLPFRERLRLAWHVLKGNDIYDGKRR